MESNKQDMESNKQDAEGHLLLEYLPKLIRLAEANMSGGLKKRIDPPEVANSVLGSVIRMQVEGKLQVRIGDSEAFLSLLTTIALNKIRKKARFHRAKKRDYRREITPHEDSPSLSELIEDTGEPNASDGAHLARVLTELENRLNADELIVLIGKRDGEIAETIAGRLNGGRGRSTKTVQRVWERVHKIANDLVEEFDV